MIAGAIAMFVHVLSSCGSCLGTNRPRPRQIIKPGMKRKEVEEYLRSNKIEFVQLLLDDLTQIGEGEPSCFAVPPEYT